MARLFAGEKNCKTDDLQQLLERYRNGLSEAEIAEMLAWERRTVNNYLRKLEKTEQVYKEGRLWFIEE
jgi:DNA-binding NarL/FixJ family response regulator